jgi:hypothetical protein
VTPTEQLLADTLADRAAQVNTDTLRPLAEVRSVRPMRALRRLAPASAAVVAIAAIGLAVFAAQLVTRSARPFANVGTASSPPPYYVSIERDTVVTVRSTATGKVTATIPQPDWMSGGMTDDNAVASSANGRVFVVAYDDWYDLRTRLLRFSLTSTGQITGLAQIPRPPRGLAALSVAVSPDGSQAAVAGIPDVSRSIQASNGPPRLVVVNLRTGSSRVWPGLRGTRDTDSIRDVTWADHGRSLRFLVTTCPGGRALPYNLACQNRMGSAGHEWTLRVPAGPHPLGSGRPLMTLPREVGQAIPGPGGGAITTMTVARHMLTVARYAVPSGRPLSVLYRGHTPSDMLYGQLSSDGSGRYLILNEELGTVLAWIDHGRLHRLHGDSPEIVSRTVW